MLEPNPIFEQILIDAFRNNDIEIVKNNFNKVIKSAEEKVILERKNSHNSINFDLILQGVLSRQLPITHTKSIKVYDRAVNVKSSILEFIKAHPGTTKSDITVACNIKAGHWNYHQAALKKAGQIRAVGIKRATKYYAT